MKEFRIKLRDYQLALFLDVAKAEGLTVDDWLSRKITDYALETLKKETEK